MAYWWVRVALGAWLVAGCGDDAGGPEGAPSDDNAGSASTAGVETTEASGAGEPTAGTAGSAGSAGGTGATTGPGVPMCEDGGWEDDGVTTGGDESGGDDGGTFGMDDDMPLVVEVFDVQQGAVGPGDLVALEGVVVTSPGTLSETGLGYEVFVQDPSGGPYSGLRVRMASNPASIAALGDSLSVTGRVRVRDGFYLVDVVGSQAGVANLGPGTLPDPPVLDAATLEIASADVRPYEGVPIRVEQVMVTDDDPCDGEFEIEQTARVDDRFFPGQIAAPTQGEVIVAVEGVLIYAVDAYEIAPADAAAIE